VFGPKDPTLGGSVRRALQGSLRCLISLSRLSDAGSRFASANKLSGWHDASFQRVRKGNLI